MARDDASVAGLAQANLSGVIGRPVDLVGASAPISAEALGAAIAGYDQVQFAVTDGGKTLLLGWSPDNTLDVFSIGSELRLVARENPAH